MTFFGVSHSSLGVDILSAPSAMAGWKSSALFSSPGVDGVEAKSDVSFVVLSIAIG